MKAVKAKNTYYNSVYARESSPWSVSLSGQCGC